MTLHRFGSLRPLATGVVLAAALARGGCSSSPSEDELRQLEMLKAEVTSLQKKVGDLEQKKANLEKELADLRFLVRPERFMIFFLQHEIISLPDEGYSDVSIGIC